MIRDLVFYFVYVEVGNKDLLGKNGGKEVGKTCGKVH